MTSGRRRPAARKAESLTLNDLTPKARAGYRKIRRAYSVLYEFTGGLLPVWREVQSEAKRIAVQHAANN